MAFRTDEQRRDYGTFTSAPDDGQAAGCFLSADAVRGRKKGTKPTNSTTAK
ncbi:hypothetical protein [Streptomyces sp. NPDC059564]|uniref:hypothetical protein n=1 Tax=Streptomyces sp. NPDC059564 TaxID=3346865 RepID=UPI0036C95AFC